MNLTIGVISPHASAEDMYGYLAEDAKCRLIFRVGYLHRAAELALELQDQLQVDAIITMGVPMEIFTDDLSVPVFPVYLGNFEILQALHKAKQYGSDIALSEIPFKAVHYDFKGIREILGFDIARYTFLTQEGIEETVRQVAKDKRDVLVTDGGYASSIAKSIGLRTIVILPERRAFWATREHIINLYSARNAEAEKLKWLNAVLDSADEGVMVLDHSKRVMVVNNSALKLSRLKKRDIIGKHVDAIKSPNPLLMTFLNLPGPFSIHKDSNKEYLISKQPIHADGVALGYRYSIKLLKELQLLEMNARNMANEHGFVAANEFSSIKGDSLKIRQLKENAKKYARSKANILLSGESGSGKEMYAQSIHNYSQCADGPFVAINCAALGDNLLESELFGYEDGAFTGARKGGKPGLFEQAHMGTLFLDEIGDMPLHIQVKLLRVLQERKVRRLGGVRNIPVDVRFIFATNKDLNSEVRTKQFREDLYYRINVLPLHVPPLREHKEDIGDIARAIVAVLGAQNGVYYEVTDAHIESMQGFDWPGNIRELTNFLERVVTLGVRDMATFNTMLHGVISDDAHPPTVLHEQLPNEITLAYDTLDTMTNKIVASLYHRNNGNKRKVEQILEISPSTLWRRLKEIGETL